MDHFLHLRNRKDRIHTVEWWCSCGKANGTAKSAVACQAAYSQHLIKAVMSGGRL